MYKARVQNQLLCNECVSSLIIKYDEKNKDYYYVCPMNSISVGRICPQSKFKFKIPVVTLTLELYEAL